MAATPFRLLVTTHPGLEAVLAAELTGIGASPEVVEAGALECDGTAELLARANLELRTAGRVTVRLHRFAARSFHQLERHASRIAWDRFLPPGTAAHVRVTTRKSRLSHERAIVERFGAAITARCRDVAVVAARGEATEEEQAGLQPVQRFVVRFSRDECVVSVDTSGPLLHRRGYRGEAGRAPLRETLAAGLLLAAGYDGSAPLVDPFCGSGTIPIEAALLARRIAPGLGRGFAFERWPETDAVAVERLRARLREQIVATAPSAIIGADRDAGAIRASRDNAARATVADAIVWHTAPVSALQLPAEPGWLITNPPYGGRVGNPATLRDLYGRFGAVLRRRAVGWRVALLSPDRRLDGQTGLDFETLVTTSNGGIRVRMLGARIAAA